MSSPIVRFNNRSVIAHHRYVGTPDSVVVDCAGFYLPYYYSLSLSIKYIRNYIWRIFFFWNPVTVSIFQRNSSLVRATTYWVEGFESRFLSRYFFTPVRIQVNTLEKPLSSSELLVTEKVNFNTKLTNVTYFLKLFLKKKRVMREILLVICEAQVGWNR